MKQLFLIPPVGIIDPGHEESRRVHDHSSRLTIVTGEVQSWRKVGSNGDKHPYHNCIWNRSASHTYNFGKVKKVLMNRQKGKNRREEKRKT
jgi:hypothetical protein